MYTLTEKNANSSCDLNCNPMTERQKIKYQERNNSEVKFQYECDKAINSPFTAHRSQYSLGHKKKFEITGPRVQTSKILSEMSKQNEKSLEDAPEESNSSFSQEKQTEKQLKTERSQGTHKNFMRQKSAKNILMANPKLQKLFSLERSSSKRSSIISLSNFNNQQDNQQPPGSSDYQQQTQKRSTIINPKDEDLNNSNSEFSDKKNPKAKSFYNVISDFYLARKFIENLKIFSNQRGTQKIRQKGYEIIGDDCEFTQDLQTETKFGFCKRIHKKVKIHSQFILSKLDRWFRPFDPDSRFCIACDIIHLLFISFYLFIFPLEASFKIDFFLEVKMSQLSQNLVELFGFISFALVIIINFNKSYYHKGNFITKRRKIFKRYLKFHFIIDAIGYTANVVRYLRSVKYSNNQLDQDDINNFKFIEIIQVAFILKMIHFFDILSQIEGYLALDDIYQNLFSMLKLFLRILFLSHIFACIWHFIGDFYKYDYSIEMNWLVKNQLQDKDLWTKYIESFYFVVITMNTVGYGDITPTNNAEKLFCICFVCIACGVFAYTLNSIQIVLNTIYKREREYKTQLNIINRFMKKQNINFDLKVRVRKYLEYMFKEQNQEQVREENLVVNNLSSQLKQELLLEAHHKIIQQFPMLVYNFSESILQELVGTLNLLTFTPGELIFQKNQIEDFSIYLVQEGNIEIFIEEKIENQNFMKILHKLKKGEVFGELSFFTNQSRSASARSFNYSKVYEIKQSDFLKILKKSQENYVIYYFTDYFKEIYCKIKDDINLYHDFKQLYFHCYICQKYDHIALQCPIVNVAIAKNVLLAKYNYSDNQERFENSIIQIINLKENLSNALIKNLVMHIYAINK